LRDSTIFYRSFYEAIKELPAINQAEVYNAIFEYSLNFNEIPLTGLSKTIFTLIKPQIDANIKRYKSGIEPKVKRNISETEAKDKQNVSETEANVNDNVNVNENNNKNNIGKRKSFTPPLLENVKLYFIENGYSEQSAEKAFNYYAINDWKDSNNNAVKNWKQKMISVWFKDENKVQAKKIYDPNLPAPQSNRIVQ